MSSKAQARTGGIAQETIEAVKSGVDLKTCIESRGIPLKKNGRGYVGLCPFHNDTSPSLSINIEKQLWQCFGCGAAGDVIRFVELYDKVDFTRAVETLEAGRPHLTPAPVRPVQSEILAELLPDPLPGPLPEPKIQQLLDRVITIYENNFEAAGKKALYDRGIADAGLFVKHRAGYCNGKLREILPQTGPILEDLARIGILNARGGEHFAGCLVFPVFDLDGNIVTLYGRFFHQSTKRHVFLPNRPTGCWNIGIIKACSEIILTESIIDGLSVETAGYSNVISIQGINGLSDADIDLFRQYGVSRITLLLDGDDPGRKAAARLKDWLSGFDITIKTLPDGHDPNSYLMALGADSLAGYIAAENEPVTPKDKPDTPATPALSPLTAPDPSPDIRHTPNTENDGFTVSFGLRKYRVMGLEKGSRKLKATVRIEHAGRLHVDTLDFYSARARRALAADICRTFNEAPETIEADITRLIQACENAADQPKKQAEETNTVIVAGREKEEAEAFGRSLGLVDQILADFETCGLIGEDSNKLLGYIAMTSRKLENPLALLILASSGAGKTALQDATIAFCPPEDLVKLTSLSGKALFYKEQTSLKHKVLALEEGDGAEDAFYAIRSLISAGVLTNETTIKDLATGRLTTMKNEVEGPTAVFYTTTRPDTDPETKSRFFVTGIDESREQTRRILSFQRKQRLEDDVSACMTRNEILRRHWNFQRLLQPLGVKNPYADYLSYGDDRLQGRRDQPKYLNLINGAAFMRQMQKTIKYERRDGKPVPYVAVDLEDIRIANKLTHEVLGRSLDELSRPGRDLLILLDEMVEYLWQKIREKDGNAGAKRLELSFTRRDIREYTGWSNTRVHRYLKELIDLEYVLVDRGGNGSQYRYRLTYEGQGKDGSKFVLGLTSVENLVKGS